MGENEQVRLMYDSDAATRILRQSASANTATQPLPVLVIDSLDDTQPQKPQGTGDTPRILTKIRTGEKVHLCGLLGEMIRDKRKKAKLSRAELARMTHIKVKWLRLLENGYLEVNRVSPIALQRIAHVFKIPVIALEILCQVDNNSLADDIDALKAEE
jgi:ribosome-binding protein aMBF1 (putative translation factor)